MNHEPWTWVKVIGFSENADKMDEEAFNVDRDQDRFQKKTSVNVEMLKCYVEMLKCWNVEMLKLKM